MNRTERYFANGELISESERDISWNALRANRNQALKDSDWRFMSDQTPSDEWILYRTFLRNLPQNHLGELANDACDAWNDYEKPEV